MKMFRE